MIKLTRLDGSEVYLNPDLIEMIEETPDTHVTLTNGNKYLFFEPARVVIERIVSYQARILRHTSAEAARKYLNRRHADKYRPLCKL